MITPECIQQRLTKLRAFVSVHAHVLRGRHGSSVLQKPRQTASKEEQTWYKFLMRHVKCFTAADMVGVAMLLVDAAVRVKGNFAIYEKGARDAVAVSGWCFKPAVAIALDSSNAGLWV